MGRNLSSHWILNDDHEPVEVDVMVWARWFEDFSNRRVAETTVGPWWVSTVFLGLDHGFMGPKTLLFETMVFWDKDKQTNWDEVTNLSERYSTWDGAMAGHNRIVKKVEDWLRTKTALDKVLEKANAEENDSELGGEDTGAPTGAPGEGGEDSGAGGGRGGELPTDLPPE